MDPILEIVNTIVINKVRERLVNEMTAHSDLYDECDLERVRSNDWTIKRYLLLTKGNVENAFVKVRDAMKWRKSYGVNTRTDLDFPMEFYKVGAIFPYFEDKEGRVVIYMRVKLYKCLPKVSDVIKQFMVHIINKIDIQSGEKGFVMVWDLTGTGPSNWDLSMVRFLTTCFPNYFPDGDKCLYVFGIPWIMNIFVSIAMKLMPEEARKKLKFISKDQIFEFIEPTNTPDFIIGGQCDKNYREIPKGVKVINDMADERGISSQEVENFLKYYENYLK